MAFPPPGEAHWSTASSAGPSSEGLVPRNRPLNRVPLLAREEPALMLSGAANLRLIPRKEGVPSWVDDRRGAAGSRGHPSTEGPQGQRSTKNDLIPDSTHQRESPDPPGTAPGPRRQTSGQPRQRGLQQWGTTTEHRAHTRPPFRKTPCPPCLCGSPQAYCPQLRASPDKNLRVHPLTKGRKPQPANGQGPTAQGQSDWRGRTT